MQSTDRRPSDAKDVLRRRMLALENAIVDDLYNLPNDGSRLKTEASISVTREERTKYSRQPGITVRITIETTVPQHDAEPYE